LLERVLRLGRLDDLELFFEHREVEREPVEAGAAQLEEAAVGAVGDEPRGARNDLAATRSRGACTIAFTRTG